jgi:hypothetical protein
VRLTKTAEQLGLHLANRRGSLVGTGGAAPYAEEPESHISCIRNVRDVGSLSIHHREQASEICYQF